MKANRAPSSVWTLRRDFRDWVRTLEGDIIQIHVQGQTMEMRRADARLLQRRIAECLEATSRV